MNLVVDTSRFSLRGLFSLSPGEHYSNAVMSCQEHNGYRSCQPHSKGGKRQPYQLEHLQALLHDLNLRHAASDMSARERRLRKKPTNVI